VSAFVDTNILVRHLTGDPPEQAARASRFLAAADELLLADLVVAGVVCVLGSFYEVPRATVAQAEGSGVGAVASFDKAIDRVTTVRRIEPA
jgi:predicted nucleic acid-binding protein